MEAAVWANGNARGDGRPGHEVCSARVEFLCGELVYCEEVGWGQEGMGKGKHTLQKSMLLTPLLPSAGPTGGEGDAAPAPTISFTIWSVAARAFDMVVAE